MTVNEHDYMILAKGVAVAHELIGCTIAHPSHIATTDLCDCPLHQSIRSRTWSVSLMERTDRIPTNAARTRVMPQ